MDDNPELKAGESWDFVASWYNPLPGRREPDYTSPVDLTGWGARLQMRRAAGAPVVLELTSDPGGGLTVDGPAGSVSGLATPEQTVLIPPEQLYLWEIRVIGPGGYEKVWPRRRLYVKAAVTL